MKIKILLNFCAKIILYFILFLVIQCMSPDWRSLTNHDIGIKAAYALMTTIIFLLLSPLIDKWSKRNERPKP